MLIEQPVITNSGLESERPIMTLSAFSIQGKRNHMEDFFDIGYQMKPCDQRRPNEWPYEYFYLGVFDGHGGREAANFAKQNLMKYITQERDFWSQNDEDVMRAIRTGFARTHSAMRKVMSTWPRSNRTLPSTAGTTASIIFIKNGKFYTGHVGDSRIVISKENPETKQWISEQLTEDHKPESKQESERIQRAGGEVRDKVGVHRVVWKRPLLKYALESKLFRKNSDFEKKVNSYPIAESYVSCYQTIPFLAIARSLGDFWSLNPYSGQYIVSPEPDVTCRLIEPNDSCILLATDGLWNIMNSSHAVRILQELDTLKIRQNQYDDDEYFAVDNFYHFAGSSENHAKSLVYIAYQLWERKQLRSDNITVVSAMLHDILGSFHRTNKPYATRASLNSPKVSLAKEIPKADPVQIEQATSYLEKVTLTMEPKFSVDLPEIPDEMWPSLRFDLILPPTLLASGQHCHGLESPRNYVRLTSAPCRKIPRPHRYYGFDRGMESYVYIKEVSDDPADSKQLPTRISKSGKEVRDASAQATQPMHDFGQPWDQLEGEGHDLYMERSLSRFRQRDENDVLTRVDIDLKTNTGEDDGDGDVDVDDDDDDDDDDDGCGGTEEDDGIALDSDEGKTVPQLRCLLNYSPPPRRTTRSSYQSVSENAKRKIQIESSPIPKRKRRRSQPIQCAVK